MSLSLEDLCSLQHLDFRKNKFSDRKSEVVRDSCVENIHLVKYITRQHIKQDICGPRLYTGWVVGSTVTNNVLQLR